MATQPGNPAVGHDIFISYKREERSRVLELAERLDRIGVSVWFDASLVPGIPFDTEIHSALNAAKAVLVVWTKAAVESDWVRGEAKVGRQRKRLVSISLEDCTPPPPFNMDHTEDFSTWVPDSQEHDGWNRVLDRIGQLCGRGKALLNWDQLSHKLSLDALRRFVNEFPTDPLAEIALSELFQHEMAATRERLAKEFGLTHTVKSEISERELAIELDAANREIEILKSRSYAKIVELQNKAISLEVALLRANRRKDSQFREIARLRRTPNFVLAAIAIMFILLIWMAFSRISNAPLAAAAENASPPSATSASSRQATVPTSDKGSNATK